MDRIRTITAKGKVTTQCSVENTGNRETISVHLNAEIRNWKLEIKCSHTNFQFSCRERLQNPQYIEQLQGKS